MKGIAKVPDSAGVSTLMIAQVATKATPNSISSRERPDRPSAVRLVTL